MRILHLSDIHLNDKNIEELKNYYIESLFNDLKKFHEEKRIEVIVITGDLVDKGGSSLGAEPYKTFKKNFLEPLAEKLNFPLNRILIIPGNHDTNNEFIKQENEYFLSHELNCDLANRYVEDLKHEFRDANYRIEKFKNFEKDLHSSTENYVYTNMHSSFIFEYEGFKIGFALINDSWRCSPTLKKDQHFIGHSQLFKTRNKFVEEDTDLNLAIFHHPLAALNGEEQAEIKTILKRKNFDIAIFGHNHKYESEKLISSYGGYLSLQGRSAFSDPNESSSIYQPGYNLLDINPREKTYKIIARKFIKSSYRFDKDTDSIPDGEESGLLPKNERLYPLAEDTNNEDKNLPDSYTADVDRIVGLLIGESIYPDKYAFVRELVQNSVDACHRVIETNSHAKPKIIITIDPESNYIQVYDEGDGMNKKVIKNHFAVIGKSISQDYNENNQRSNLISKFGIGFISTFIAAEKVVINTKTEEDGIISFEIEDVFKGFKYFDSPHNEFESSSGTSVRVYLKKDFDINTAYSTIKRYCRHIDNLEIKHGTSIVKIEEQWNMEDSNFYYKDKNNRYTLKLGLNPSTKGLFASYCGFLISNFPQPIIPFRFPSHIVGEINFTPKNIDFDISRTNIISTEKSFSVQREISSSLRKLFRDCLESGRYHQLYPVVVNYLQFYLQYYDQLKANFDRSYQDFYSKKELITLCLNHIYVPYGNQEEKLSEILILLKARSIDVIYSINATVISDFQKIVVQYLESKGNLVLRNSNVNVSFHDVSQQSVNLNNVVQIICKEISLPCHDISALSPSILSEMTMDKGQFPIELQNLIKAIEKEYHINIEVGKFNSMNKASVNNSSTFYLNYEHQTFQSILRKSNTENSDKFKVYLLGIIGMDLKDN